MAKDNDIDSESIDKKSDNTEIKEQILKAGMKITRIKSIMTILETTEFEREMDKETLITICYEYACDLQNLFDEIEKMYDL